eukprot:scaffold2751_cov131-Cylindrotheca_fusiformis.AAC.22
MFRGRGGPTDGRLPKYNARTSKPQRQTEFSMIKSKYGNSDLPKAADQQSNVEVEEIEIVPPRETRNSEHKEVQQLVNDTDPADDHIASPCQKELKHLRKRIQNVQESMVLSESISNPNTYEENVLNASANCVNEWRQIIRHYSQDEAELPDQDMKEVSLEIFQLIQLSLQSGPLAGGKPGYFKRCGSQVAKRAFDYIARIAPNLETSYALGFTEKQAGTIETWKSNAEKAAAKGKPPSKSQLKKQLIASKKKKKG